MDKQDILTTIHDDISALISEKFQGFISEKVKQEVEKETDTFLKDLNMCEEEFLVFDDGGYNPLNSYIKIYNEEQMKYIFNTRYKTIKNNNENEYFYKFTDLLTNKGNIMPTNRNGINRSNIGPLAKVTFEDR